MSLLSDNILESNNKQVVVASLQNIPEEQIAAFLQAWFDILELYVYDIKQLDLVSELLYIYKNDLYIPKYVHHINTKVIYRAIPTDCQKDDYRLIDEWIYDFSVNKIPINPEDPNTYDTFMVGCFGIKWTSINLFHMGWFRKDYNVFFSNEPIKTKYKDYYDSLKLLIDIIK